MFSYRVLRPDEWGRVQEISPEYKFPMPDRAGIVVAEQGDKIVSYVVVQPVWHVEPFYAAPELRGTGQTGEMVKEFQKVIESELIGNSPYYCFSPFTRADELLGSIGFEKQPWSVWMKRGH